MNRANWRGGWCSGRAYLTGDVVTVGGACYVCVQAHSLGRCPPHSAYWCQVIQDSLSSRLAHTTDVISLEEVEYGP